MFDFKTRAKSSNKRPSPDSDDYFPNPAKRLTVDTDVRNFRRDIGGPFMGTPQTSTSHRTFLDTPPSSIPSTLHPSMSMPPQAFKHIQPPQPPPPPPPPSQLVPQAPKVQKQPPPQPLPEVAPVPSSPEAHSDDSPALVRTSQLRHDARPEQASVAIQGDLENMKRGWCVSFLTPFHSSSEAWLSDAGPSPSMARDVALSNFGSGKLVQRCIYPFQGSCKPITRKTRSLSRAYIGKMSMTISSLLSMSFISSKRLQATDLRLKRRIASGEISRGSNL